MFTLTILTPWSSAMRSSTGATAWQGPHHSAQKSTITLPSPWRTSCSNVLSVAWVGMDSFPGFDWYNEPRGRILPRLDWEDVRPSARAARFQRPRARGARALGARAHVRAAPGAEPGRPPVVV